MCKKLTKEELADLEARYAEEDEYDPDLHISCCWQWCDNPAYPDCALGCDNYYNENE